MSKHLFGIVLTPHGIAANNRGETEGNITTLQKILWRGEQHTTVSAEAIRWAIRWFWQQKLVDSGTVLNRTWKEAGEKPRNDWKQPDFSGWLKENGERYMDDDVLGFMSAEAAKAEGNTFEKTIALDSGREILFDVSSGPDADETETPPSKFLYKLVDEAPVEAEGDTLRLRFYAVGPKKAGKEKQEQKGLLDSAEKTVLGLFEKEDIALEMSEEDRHGWNDALKGTGRKSALRKSLDEFVNPKGTTVLRRARLEVTRAVSLTPYEGDMTFNAASVGATPSASRTGGDPVPYGTEVHATRYQFGFALTPESLNDSTHAEHVVDAIVALGNVGGNHARFLFDFSPETVVFRWTDDFAPRMLYGFCLDDDGKPNVADVIDRVRAGDINPDELIIGGVLSEESTRMLREAAVANIFTGVRKAAEKVKELLMKANG